MRVEIFVGKILKCPLLDRMGRFAYHMVIDGESRIDNLCYSGLDASALERKLYSLSKNYKNTRLVNGIQRGISGGFAPEYKFTKLSNWELSNLVKNSKSLLCLDGK